MLRITGWMLAAVISLGVIGCAAGAGGNEAMGEPGDGIAIVVNNDRIPPSSATVYIVPDTGGRQRLGIVNGGARQTFSYRPASLSGEYRLVAEMVGASDVSSNPFNFLGGATRVEWSTDQGQVRVTR